MPARVGGGVWCIYNIAYILGGGTNLIESDKYKHKTMQINRFDRTHVIGGRGGGALG